MACLRVCALNPPTSILPVCQVLRTLGGAAGGASLSVTLKLRKYAGCLRPQAEPFGSLIAHAWRNLHCLLVQDWRLPQAKGLAVARKSQILQSCAKLRGLLVIFKVVSARLGFAFVFAFAFTQAFAELRGLGPGLEQSVHICSNLSQFAQCFI